jgi:hypothetical protein
MRQREPSGTTFGVAWSYIPGFDSFQSAESSGISVEYWETLISPFFLMLPGGDEYG